MFVNEKQWTWHRRLGHVSMRRISMLNNLNLVRNLPNLNFSLDSLCDACYKGKISKSFHKYKNIVSTTRPLELFHIDLFGPVKTASVNARSTD